MQINEQTSWVWVVAVKCSITKNNSGSFSASHSELPPLCSMKFLFYVFHSFPIFAWGICMILALCHEGTTNKRYSKSKGNCHVRDRSKVLQGMTPGCSLCTTGHIKKLCMSFPFCPSLFVFASAPACLYFSILYLPFRSCVKWHGEFSSRFTEWFCV